MQFVPGGNEVGIALDRVLVHGVKQALAALGLLLDDGQLSVWELEGAAHVFRVCALVLHEALQVLVLYCLPLVAYVEALLAGVLSSLFDDLMDAGLELGVVFAYKFEIAHSQHSHYGVGSCDH